MQQVTDLRRRSIIRLMNAPSLTTERRLHERSPVYGAMVKDALRIVAKVLDYPAAERLKHAHLSTARRLSSFGKLELNKEMMEKLD